MAHITEFSVTGLVGRQKVFRHTLDRTTNVFFGENGCGKTSLLRIFHAAMSMDASLLTNVGFKSAEVSIFSIQKNQVFTLTFDKKKSGKIAIGGDDVEPGTLRADTNEPPTWKVTPKPEFKRWQHKYLPTTRLYASEDPRMSPSSAANARAARVTAEEQLDLNFARMVQSTWSARFGETMRAVGNAQQAGLSRVLGEVLSHEPEAPSGKYDLQPNRAFESMLKFLNRQGSERDHKKMLGTTATFNKRYKSDPLLRSVVKRIDEVETGIERVTQPARDLSALVERLFSKGKTVHFDGPAISITTSEGTLPLEQLSSGEKHLIRILLDAIDVGASTLIIDEPELSMHIDWQKELIKNMLILNPQCQLILATHSPEIMSEIEDKNIFKIK